MCALLSVNLPNNNFCIQNIEQKQEKCVLRTTGLQVCRQDLVRSNQTKSSSVKLVRVTMVVFVLRVIRVVGGCTKTTKTTNTKNNYFYVGLVREVRVSRVVRVVQMCYVGSMCLCVSCPKKKKITSFLLTGLLTGVSR